MSDKYSTQAPRMWLELFFIARGWIALAGAGVLLMLSLGAAYDVYQTDHFNAEATQVDAQVIRFRGDDAIVRYTTPQGTFAMPLRRGTLEQDDTVTIWYNADDPTDISKRWRRSVPVGTYPSQILGLLSGLAALCVLWWSGSAASEAVRTRKFGPERPAQVTRVEVGKDADGDPVGRGRLHWREADGRTGVSFWYPLAHVKRWAQAPEISVYRGTRRSWWRDDLGPREPLPTRVPVVQPPVPHGD